MPHRAVSLRSVLICLSIAAIACPALAGAAREFPLFTGPGGQLVSKISRNRILAWGDPGPLPWTREIQVYDLYKDAWAPVPTVPDAAILQADICEDTVVWTHDVGPRDEEGRPTETHIYATNLSTDEVYPVHIGPGWHICPRVSSEFIVWFEYRDPDRAIVDIYSYDRSSGTVSPVCPRPEGYDDKGLALFGSRAVWAQFLGGPDSNMHACDLATGDHFTISVDTEVDHLALWGDSLVFTTERDLYHYDLKTRTKSRIANSASPLALPLCDICADVVVQTDVRDYTNSYSDIYAYDLATDQESLVCGALSWQLDPRIYGDLVIWDDGRNDLIERISSYDLYAADLERLPFWDVPADEWSFPAITALKEADIVWGYHDRSYRPKYQISRDQMAVYIARALVGGEGNVPEGPPTPSFPDVRPGFWAYNHIEYAVHRHVVQGYEDGRYHPKDLLDRGQIAVFVARSIADPTGEEGLAGYTPPGTPTFDDVPLDYWSYKHVEYLTDQGVISPEEPLYRPEDPCLRDYMALLVARAFQLIL